jgi:hypothetical protein
MKDQSNEMLLASKEKASHITPEGQRLLEQAHNVDLATAVFRNRWSALSAHTLCSCFCDEQSN